MFEPIFTTISAVKRVYDKHNQLLPPGNYYYEITSYIMDISEVIYPVKEIMVYLFFGQKRL